MKIKTPLSLLIFFFIIISSDPSYSKSMIQYVKNTSIVDGCSCSFQKEMDFKKSNYNFIFLSEVEENPAWMNIDGKDVKLKLIQKKMAKNFKMGAKDVLFFVGPDDIQVKQTRSINFMCKKSDVECEYTGYKSSFEVQKGTQKEIVDLLGGCGC